MRAVVSMLRAENLRIEAGSRALLDDVSLTFAPGQLAALVGPNGAGKTTLLRCLDGELAPAAGRVELNGRALADWRRRDLARARAVLPQESTLDFPFSARDVVLLGRIPHAGDDAMDRAIARRALALCDCAELEARDYPSLSGGEKQRVQTARALAQLFDGDGGLTRHPRSVLSGGGDGDGDRARARLTERGRGGGGDGGRGGGGDGGRDGGEGDGGGGRDGGGRRGGGAVPPRHPRSLLSGGGDGGARFLLLDEPASALDLRHQYQLLGLLKTLARADGLGVVCALHNLNLVAQFADRATLIDRGMVVADGAPLHVFTEETVGAVFDLEVSIGPHPDNAKVPLLLPRLPAAAAAGGRLLTLG